MSDRADLLSLPLASDSGSTLFLIGRAA